MAADLADQRMRAIAAQQGIDNLMRSAQFMQQSKRQQLLDELARQKLQQDQEIARWQYVDRERTRRETELDKIAGARERAQIAADAREATDKSTAQYRELLLELRGEELARKEDQDAENARIAREQQTKLDRSRDVTALTRRSDPESLQAALDSGKFDDDPLAYSAVESKLHEVMTDRQQIAGIAQSAAAQLNESVLQYRRDLKKAEEDAMIPYGRSWNPFTTDAKEKAEDDARIKSSRLNLSTAVNESLRSMDPDVRQLVRQVEPGVFEPNPEFVQPTRLRSRPGARGPNGAAPANPLGRGMAPSGVGASAPGPSFDPFAGLRPVSPIAGRSNEVPQITPSQKGQSEFSFNIRPVSYMNVPNMGIVARDENGKQYPLHEPMKPGAKRDGYAIIVGGKAVDLTSDAPEIERAYLEISAMMDPNSNVRTPEDAMVIAVERVVGAKLRNILFPTTQSLTTVPPLEPLMIP